MSTTQLYGKSEGQIQNDNLQQYVKSPQKKTTKELKPGTSAISMMGGLLYPLLYKEVLPGEYIRELSIENLTRMLTPLVPTFDKVFMKIDAYFVPHTRVWKDAEKNLANKNDTENRNNHHINKLPTLEYQYLNTYSTKSPYKFTLLNRYGIPNAYGGTLKINPLLLRGYRAIFNDFIRIKDYEPKKVEWNETLITAAEISAIEAFTDDDGDIKNSNAYIIEAAPTRKGYLTNIKSRLSKGMDTLDSLISHDGGEIGEHLDWQTRYNDAKQSQDNANKNDWDIVAEMGGTQPINYNQVEHLGSIEYQLNYQQITQSAPEINESTPLGTTGSFSYTRADGVLFNHKEFKQHGFIHILINLQIDKAMERSINKELLKTSVEDIFRPGLADKEIQLLQNVEIGAGTTGVIQGIAYQPPWSEYKRLPSLTTGEMETTTLTELNGFKPGASNSQWHNKIATQGTNATVLPNNYFRNADEVNRVLARNNVLTLQLAPMGQWPYSFFVQDPILNMAEVRCKVSLPIEKKVIDQVEYSNDKR